MASFRQETNRKKIREALSDGEKTFGELQKTTGLSSPTLSEHLKNMEEQRTLTSERDPDDRRKRIYKLPLPGGKKGEILRQLNDQLDDPLTKDEVNELSELLSDEVVETLEEISQVSIGFTKVSLLDALWFYDAERRELDIDEIRKSIADPEKMQDVAKAVWSDMLPADRVKERMEKILSEVDTHSIVKDNLPSTPIAEKRGVEEELDKLTDRLRDIADGERGGAAYRNRKKTYELYAPRLWAIIQPEIVKKYAAAAAQFLTGEQSPQDKKHRP